MIRLHTADPEQRAHGLGAAAAALRRGQLVGLPLDTTYGIAADAFSERGTAALRAAKGRADLSIPVMVPKLATVAGLAEVDALVRRLMLDFWPGPLTLVLRAQSTLAWSLTDPAGRIAVRMPLHPVALELLERTGPLGIVAGSRTPAVAPSACAPAHASSQPAVSCVDLGPEPSAQAATTAQYPVVGPDTAFPPELADLLTVLLDAGPLPAAAPSAVVDLTSGAPLLVRPGSLPLAALRESCPGLVVPNAVGQSPAP